MGWGVEAEAGERGAGLGLSTSGTRRGNYLATISRGGAPEVSPSAPTHSLACSSNPEMTTGGGPCAFGSSDGRLPRYSLRGSCTARAAQRCHRSPGYRKGTAGKPGAATGDPHHDHAVLATWTRREHGVSPRLPAAHLHLRLGLAIEIAIDETVRGLIGLAPPRGWAHAGRRRRGEGALPVGSLPEARCGQPVI